MTALKVRCVFKPFSGGGLPGNGREVGDIKPTVQEAASEGLRIIAEYERKDPYGNMGVFVGVSPAPFGFRAVINTFHSNT